MATKKQGYGDESSHLWVGNLPFDVSEAELTALFEKHGVIDGVTCYASRSYAFVYYKRVEDAVAAKDSLQGFVLNGNQIKIEFAKPAKPSKHVWVGGFSSALTREKLEEELSKFGKIEDFKFIRDRNSALVDFVRLEDAIAAVKNLNGLQIGDDSIRVDFLRSHPARREQTEFMEMGSAQWINPDIMRNYSEPTYSGHKRPQPSQSVGGRKGDNPSKVLWVGYPPTVIMDEDMLHNAMILHGEIERVKCYHGRNYSFVEFRSIEEARRAKEALQGRLFNDPRIVIMFSNSNLAPGKDFDASFSRFGGQRPEIVGNKGSFRPPLVDVLSHMPPNSFSGTNGRLGRNMIRPIGPKGNSGPLLPTPDLHDTSMHPVMSDLPGMPPFGINQRKLSPSGAGLLPSPALSSRSGFKTSGWDVIDPSLPVREQKRSRTDGSTLQDTSDEYDDQHYGSGPPFGGGALARGQAESGLSLRNNGVSKGPVHGRDDYVWRGVIAKGGTPVCHARCIPMGKDIEFDMPEVVNCSARTGLNMLAKHYAGAFGFDIVFFLPDSEDDFANYTEFLRYLGSKNRAGVAKLDDGTTLFLVPPSDFLTDVLKVTGRERLYGVVLKLQPTPPGPPRSLQPTPPGPPSLQQFNHPPLPSHDYSVPKQEFSAHAEYNSSVPQSNNAFSTVSGPALSLTPELIASLQSIQSAAQSSTTSHSLNNQPQASTQFGIQPFPAVSNEPKFPTNQNYPSFPTNQNFSGHHVPNHPENVTMQNYGYNFQEQGPVPPRPTLTHPVAQSYPGEVSHNVQQGYAGEASLNVQQGYGMSHGTPTGSYSVADSQQQYNPGSYPNQLPDGNSNASCLEINLPGLVGNSKTEPSGGSQGAGEAEVDKNQRYQSTLQFAASLLLQIQQQQQQQQGGSNMGNQQ